MILETTTSGSASESLSSVYNVLKPEKHGCWDESLQTLSVEEAQARRARLAKLRSLLFHQEAKLTHAARIKSKAYHRRLKRTARLKVLPSLRVQRVFLHTGIVF